MRGVKVMRGGQGNEGVKVMGGGVKVMRGVKVMGGVKVMRGGQGNEGGSR